MLVYFANNLLDLIKPYRLFNIRTTSKSNPLLFLCHSDTFFISFYCAVALLLQMLQIMDADLQLYFYILDGTAHLQTTDDL